MAEVREATVSEALAEIRAHRTAEEKGTLAGFWDWSMRVPEPKAGTLNIKRFPYQAELYSQLGADAKEIVVKKATQVGVSTYGLRWVMYHADMKRRNMLYLFPTRQQMYDFADARIKAAILASDYLRQRIPGGYVNNKGLKRIGLGYLYCRGSESPNELQSIDADGLFMDEYDDIRRENIPDAERRISGPDSAGLIRRVGVPQYPGSGLDRLYEESDQRQWVVKCPNCGHRQPITFEANVDEETATRRCNGEGTRNKKQRNCRAELDVLDGEWVATFEDRDTIGYHLPRLIVANASIRDIIKARQSRSPTDRQVHFNKDLGLAYAPEEGRLSEDAIRRAQRPEFPLEFEGDRAVAWRNPGKREGIRTMGVDVATVRNLHVRISEHRGEMAIPLYIGEVEDFNAVAKLMRRFDVNFACVDHEPDGRLGRALGQRYPGRVYTVSYGTDKQLDYIKPSIEDRHVSVKRTTVIDDTLDEIRHQIRLLPGENLDGLPLTYQEHMQAPVRIVERDEFDRTTVRYENQGDADYAMAEVYDYTAFKTYTWLLEVERAIEGEDVQADDVVDIERQLLDVGTHRREIEIDEYGAGEFSTGDRYDPGEF